MEPNRTELPSVRRQLFRNSAPPRLETVRIRIGRPEDEEDGVKNEGNVSGQWDNLCHMALLETEKVVASLNIYDNLQQCDNKDGLNKSSHPNQSIAIIFATQNLNLMQVNINFNKKSNVFIPETVILLMLQTSSILERSKVSTSFPFYLIPSWVRARTPYN